VAGFGRPRSRVFEAPSAPKAYRIHAGFLRGWFGGVGFSDSRLSVGPQFGAVFWKWRGIPCRGLLRWAAESAKSPRRTSHRAVWGRKPSCWCGFCGVWCDGRRFLAFSFFFFPSVFPPINLVCPRVSNSGPREAVVLYVAGMEVRKLKDVLGLERHT